MRLQTEKNRQAEEGYDYSTTGTGKVYSVDYGTRKVRLVILAREELKLGQNLNMHFRLVVDGVHSTLIAPTMTFLDDYCPAILSIRQHPLL